MKALLPLFLVAFLARSQAQEISPGPGKSPGDARRGGHVHVIDAQQGPAGTGTLGEAELDRLLEDALENASDPVKLARKLRTASELARGPAGGLDALWSRYLENLGNRPAWSRIGVSLNLPGEEKVWSGELGEDSSMARVSLLAQLTKARLAERAALGQLEARQTMVKTCRDALEALRSSRIRGRQRARLLENIFGKLSRAEFGLRQGRDELDRVNRQIELLTGRSGRSLTVRRGEGPVPPRTHTEVRTDETPKPESPVQRAEKVLVSAEAKLRELLAENRAQGRGNRPSMTKTLEKAQRETDLRILLWNVWRERQGLAIDRGLSERLAVGTDTSGK